MPVARMISPKRGVIRLPWHVENDNPNCAGFAVVKDADGSVEGCHDTEADAQAQVEALYANEPARSAAALPPDGPPCYGVICVEGIPTAEYPRRVFAPGAFTWANPPLSLKWQPAEAVEHDGSVVVAR